MGQRGSASFCEDAPHVMDVRARRMTSQHLILAGVFPRAPVDTFLRLSPWENVFGLLHGWLGQEPIRIRQMLPGGGETPSPSWSGCFLQGRGPSSWMNENVEKEKRDFRETEREGLGDPQVLREGENGLARGERRMENVTGSLDRPG